MAQNITLLGASYSDVPAVTLPKTGGGTARFDDCSVVTASASDVASGKIFVASDGTITTGTSSGGGGTGLVYETGTYTPTSDIARPQILWTNSHTEAPVLVLFSDVTGTAHSTTNSNYVFAFVDPYKLWGKGFPYTSSGYRYAVAYYSYRGSSTKSISTGSVIMLNNSDSTTSNDTSYPRYWVSPTDFHPYSNSSSRYWSSGRTFKWIAVWKPTS